MADGVGKRFTRRVPGSSHRWRQWLPGSRSTSSPPPFWALRDVSFTVNPGEMLGVIGANGAGKSTLLCLLSGISDPTEGTVRVEGRIGALLELGGGFVEDLTGRENAILAGVSAGLTRREVRARLDAMVAFAEIQEFLDDPVRMFSTGMRMRLAFAVAVHTDPEVLLVDEFLAVGDLAFQARCRARIAELRTQGCSVVAVTHGLADVRETCDRVLWLQNGGVAALDAPDVVTTLYEAEMHERTLKLTPDRGTSAPTRARGARRKSNRIGSMEMEITRVDLLSGVTLRSGAPFVLDLAYRSSAAVRAPIFVVSITREDGTVCLDTNTEAARVATDRLGPAGTLRFSIPRLELGAGRYFVNVGIFDAKWSHAYDHHWHAYPFTVDGTTAHKGVIAPPCRWDAALIGVGVTSADSPQIDEALRS